MNYPIINEEVINGSGDGATGGPAGLETILFPGTVSPLAVGAPALTSVFYVGGLPLAIIGQPGLVLGSAPPKRSFEPAGVRPLSVGRPAMFLSLEISVAAAASPVVIRRPGLLVAMTAAGVVPAAVGQPGLSLGMSPQPIRPASVGKPTLRIGMTAAGSRPVRVGTPRLDMGGLIFFPYGAAPVAISRPDSLSMSFRLHTAYPARAGSPVLDRGASC